jgi:hypothetical protein
MVYVGVNIYYWGTVEQQQFILAALRPCALEARTRNWAYHFWYCRFDARGPHIFAVFAIEEEDRNRLESFLNKQIQAFFAQSPSQANLSVEELQRRHEACRGKTLCSVDGREGLAENNSFQVFHPQPDDYPLWLSSGMTTADQFWLRLDALVFWSFQYLEQGGLRAAVRWLAAVDNSLKCAGFPAERYWRFHASTLLPSLPDNIHGKTAQQIITVIQNALTMKHRTVFSRLWDHGGQLSQDFDMDALMQCILAADGRTLDWRFRVLREVNHTLLGQLGHRVSLHIPMILYAWQRNLALLCDSGSMQTQQI